MPPAYHEKLTQPLAGLISLIIAHCTQPVLFSKMTHYRLLIANRCRKLTQDMWPKMRSNKNSYMSRAVSHVAKIKQIRSSLSIVCFAFATPCSRTGPMERRLTEPTKKLLCNHWKHWTLAIPKNIDIRPDGFWRRAKFKDAASTRSHFRGETSRFKFSKHFQTLNQSCQNIV